MRRPNNFYSLFIIIFWIQSTHSDNSKGFQNYCGLEIDQPWCIPKDYDHNIDPFYYHNLSEIPLPWNFTYDFWVNEIARVDDKRQLITFLMYFRTQWYDPRLIINLSSTEWKNRQGILKKGIMIPPSSPLWIPDLEIYGLKSFGTKRVFRDMGYLKMQPNKQLVISYYSDISITCQMNFTNFPLDEQSCDFLVTSYSKSNETLRCSSTLTNGEDLNQYPQRSLQYEISWPKKSLKKVMNFQTGSWEYCGFRIHLNRISVKYLAGAYAPAVLFVVISWLSFIIKPDAIPGRIMLLLNIFLMMIILMNDIKSSAPDTNSINALDMYLAVCTLCVFMAMIEYAIILMIMKLHNLNWSDIPQKREMRLSSDNKASTLLKIRPILTETTKSIESDEQSENETILFIKHFFIIAFYNLDWISLVLFPFVFIIFNICYWSYYY